MKVKLVFEVDFDPNDTPEEILHGNMRNIAEYAVETGMLTGNESAEVEDYSITVETVE